MGLAHWDEIEWHRRAKGELDAQWQFLGRAAGTVGVGVNRVRVAPGRLPTPPHSHGASEELFLVLAGSGLHWQDGSVHEIEPGDCVVHRADGHEHTFVAGGEGLEYLVFGTRHPTEIGWLPRSRAIRIGWPWVEGRDDDPWEREAAGPPLELGEPKPRPENIVPLGGETPSVPRDLTELAGLHCERLEPGKRSAVPHCHSEEEEIFVILGGTATLELWPSPRSSEERSDHELRAGHVVARPPGTRLSHSFLAGPGGCTLLTYGTRKPNDICFYPRSSKIFFRGLGVIARVEHVDYFDGEPDD